MRTEILNIDKGQCLTDVLPAIPANTIFDKTITGCGATHSEIVNAARHSIIIEPNIPVILGKKAEHPFLFAVYEGITKEDVKAYLEERAIFPELYSAPKGWYGTHYAARLPGKLTDDMLAAMHDYYAKLLDDYDDVMTVNDISVLTGYGKTTINKWCYSKYLKSFRSG